MTDDQKPQEAGGAGVLQAGRVSGLERQKNDPDRISVYIDDVYAFGLFEHVIAGHALHSGVYLSIPQQEELIAADRLLRAYRKALHFLGYRARSISEVTQKLVRSGYGEVETEKVIERLVRGGYLDDEAFARQYVESRVAARGYGPLRIRQDLFRKGIAGEIIEETLSAAFPDREVRRKAVAEASKRWVQLSKEPDTRKRRKKLFDFLVRRGFDFEIAAEVLNDLTQEQ
jgi:regulatory protein